ncbi:tyrosine-protein phosphatase non-receptor type 18 isoform X2 [Ochotona princeps]|uniref:tyrosine-protein phosphatase non-receptor type 18 isoform X2 n=1 Tax=Ochotona princeps TaxID=9978 RepID=UPI0027151234|nr:tyrosine-protein phosphatase non-receptor type 18 isoform X2 [Ochotona princeps]
MSHSLDAARSFLERLEAQGGWEGEVLSSEFSSILARSAAWKSKGVCSAKAGSLRENVKKNRYKDVLPYDHTRVILSLLHEEGHGDYINGNFIRGGDGGPAYIATQGPLPHTLLDFWRLVWEFRVKVILMACRETENGRKCERYWAQEQQPLQIGFFCITLTREAQLNTDVTHRSLQVTFQKESRCVHQLQYSSWPDRGVPSSSDTVLTMVEEARRLHGTSPGPLCVHCSAGCGRTGVLCALDYVRQLLLTETLPGDFSLFHLVLELRRQRQSVVQTEVRPGDTGPPPTPASLLDGRSLRQEQYRFLHRTVAQMFRSALQTASTVYQNVKENLAPVCATEALSSLRESPAWLLDASHQAGRVLRSTSEPGAPTLTMADTYAVVQKRGTSSTAGAGAGSGARTGGPDAERLYSHVTPRALRPGAQAEDNARGVLPARAAADQSPAGPDAYEEVADPAQTGGMGFNLRVGRPKGPRDPPAEWTRV